MDSSGLEELANQMERVAYQRLLEANDIHEKADPMRIHLGQDVLDLQRWSKAIRKAIE